MTSNLNFFQNKPKLNKFFIQIHEFIIHVCVQDSCLKFAKRDVSRLIVLSFVNSGKLCVKNNNLLEKLLNINMKADE